ncbi:MAG: hypothetical protein Q7S22_01130 [Candidatus Micrarchaeota archaeon]|nr:hypothetical protein [Candidatus Micrarchaeota archaeon]
MDYATAIKNALSEGRWRIAIIAMAVITPLLAVTSNIIVLSTLSITPTLELSRLIMVIIIAILMSLNITVVMYNYKQGKKTDKKTTLAGTLSALFTTACPICQPVWLFWIGLGSASAFLSEITIYFGLASILLLLVSLHFSLKGVSGKCELR